MAWKLTKSEAKEFDELRDALRVAIDAAQTFVEGTYTAADFKALQALHRQFDELAEAIVGASDSVSDWCQNFYDEKDGEWSEKSEKWQESDKGESVRVWLDEWESASSVSVSVSGGIDTPDEWPMSGQLFAEADLIDATDYLDVLDNVPTESD
jgi:hypothetical protein